jgi:hypothetical protein
MKQGLTVQDGAMYRCSNEPYRGEIVVIRAPHFLYVLPSFERCSRPMERVPFAEPLPDMNWL